MNSQIDGAKKRAKRLAQRLQSLNVRVQHTQALEALAASEGYSDWNRYQAHLQQAASLGARPTNVPSITVVALVPGSGKTTAARAQCEQRRSLGPILWINGVDTPTPKSTQPADTYTTVSYQLDGSLTFSSSSWVTDGMATLSLVPTEGNRYDAAGNQAVEKAWLALTEHVKKVFSNGWLPATVVLDNTQRACPSDAPSEFFAHLNPLLEAHGGPSQWLVLTPLVRLAQTLAEEPLEADLMVVPPEALRWGVIRENGHRLTHVRAVPATDLGALSQSLLEVWTPPPPRVDPSPAAQAQFHRWAGNRW